MDSMWGLGEKEESKIVPALGVNKPRMELLSTKMVKP